ncbi:DUF1217 domain-containing protein [Acetobacteraceae bacterium ESL0709]|nr:DUF1217 domain-containing protein [Acetobacteraceae bacterium ESL0697]MDF7679019.1 DUF1217 domain-containing protein [Acetobacteraceae bacterium ESL0709]
MALPGISPVVQYDAAIKDEQKAANIYIKTDPLSKRYEEDFRNKASSITSTKKLMQDYAANEVVLGAYNLKTVANQPALESKLLNENPYNVNSTAYKARNATWMSFADDFYKMSTTDITMGDLPYIDTTSPTLDSGLKVSQPFVENIIQNYKYNKYENSLSGGVGDALYVVRQLESGQVRNVDDILKDPKLLNFVGSVYNDLDLTSLNKMSFKDQKDTLNKFFKNGIPFIGDDGKANKPEIENLGTIYITQYGNSHNDQSNIQSYINQYKDLLKSEKDKADGYIMGDKTSTSDIETFRKNASSIKTVGDLLNDQASNRVVLGGFGLSGLGRDEERKLLLENPHYDQSTIAREAEKNDTANRRSFADSFYTIKITKGPRSMVSELDTSSTTNSGDLILSQDFVDKTLRSYELRQYETSKDLDKSGVGNALYFTRTMEQGKITDVNALMSDPTLLKVVEVVNGLNPDDIGSLDFQQQQNIIKRLFNAADFTKPNPNPVAADGSDSQIPDPQKIKRYAERYLGMLQIHPEWNSVDQPASMMDLFGGSTDDDWVVSLFA